MHKKLNIMQFICSTGFYGAERWVLALARNLDPKSVRCDLVTTRESNTGELELVSRFRQNHSALGEAFQIPMSGRFDLRSIRRLADLMKQREVDILHTHGYKSDIIGVMAARLAGVKCVVTPHGFENAPDLKLRFFIWLGCKAMKLADSVVPLSVQIHEDVRKFGVDNKRLHYIQNGVDLSEIETAFRNPISCRNGRESRKIGFIGQLISRKNVGDILDVFDSLASRHPEVELQVIGDGDQRTQLECHADGLGCRAKIDFLGFREDRLEYLKQFDLFVITSTLEGVPRCVMEAMAMGVPVAAYDIPGIDQLIEPGVTGLSAPLGDKNTLMNHWEKLLFDDAYAKNIADNARQHVHRNFSASRMAGEYMNHYHLLLGSPA